MRGTSVPTPLMDGLQGKGQFRRMGYTTLYIGKKDLELRVMNELGPQRLVTMGILFLVLKARVTGRQRNVECWLHEESFCGFFLSDASQNLVICRIGRTLNDP